MARIGLTSSLTSDLITRFSAATSGSDASASIAALKGESASSSSNFSSSLRFGAQTYGSAVQGINSLVSFTNLSQSTLKKLEKVTDKLIAIAERASKGSTGAEMRKDLDRQFKKLGNEFLKILDSSKLGENNYLEVEGLSSIFSTIGLDPETSETMASVFKKFVLTKQDDFLASENKRGSRPVPVPPDAYGVETSVDTVTPDTTTALVTRGNGTYSVDNSSDLGLVIGAGLNSTSVAASVDVNNDGFLDAVVAAGDDQAVSISLGNGNGTFKAHSTFGTSDTTTAVNGADLNGDGDIDLVSGGALGLEVHLGDGSGTYSISSSFQGAGESIDLTDMNGDGFIDIVSTDATRTNVFLNNGDGTFKAGATLEISFDAGTAAAEGDLDGDGIKDIALTGVGGSFEIHLANGDGTFKKGEYLLAGTSANDVQLHDFNRDGILDGVSTDSDTGANYIYLGNGDGTFKVAGSYITSTGITSIKLGDANQDGNYDIYTSSSDDSVSVILSNGDGSFGARTVNSGGFGVLGLTLADFTGDGVLDIASVGTDFNSLFLSIGGTSATPSTVNIGTGTFDPAVSFSTGALATDDIETADFNGDGFIDYVTPGTGGNNLRVSLGNGDGSFKTGVNYQGVGSITDSVVGDFNNDGYQDIAASASTSEFSILYGNGNGTFKGAASFVTTSSFITNITASDVTGDGHTDIILTDYSGNSIRVFKSHGDGTFNPEVRYDTVGFSPGEVSIADVNGDDKLDLFVPLAGNGYGVHLGNGDGTFSEAIGDPVAGFSLENSALADVDGDGTLDFISGSGSSGNDFRVAIGNGDGTFEVPSVYTTGRIGKIAAQDLNNDGDVDLILSRNDGTPGTIVYLNNGNGTFKISTSFANTGTSKGFALADTNGDGVLDILRTNATGTSVGVSLGTQSTSTVTETFNTGTGPRSTREFDSLFDPERNIRFRPDAYKMLTDLKSLKEQIRSNIRGLDRVSDVLNENLKLVRSAGFALLELSDQVSSADTAESLAARLSELIRQGAPGALAQANNLDPIAVAVLTLASSNSSSN